MVPVAPLKQIFIEEVQFKKDVRKLVLFLNFLSIISNLHMQKHSIFVLVTHFVLFSETKVVIVQNKIISA